MPANLSSGVTGLTAQPQFEANTLLSPASPENASTIALADVIAALSYALDITEGQPKGHSAKSCLIAMRVAQEIGLSTIDQSTLFYGTLLKDLGCSSNAAKVCSLFGADDREIKQSFKVHDLTGKIAQKGKKVSSTVLVV